MILEKIKVWNYCPYCQQKFEVKIDNPTKEKGITSYLVKPHKECGEFLIFLDSHCKIRGFQVIDTIQSDEMNSPSVDKYLELFTDDSSNPSFHHLKSFKNSNINKNINLITTKEVKYHNFTRSKLYQDWLEHLREGNHDFSFMFLNDLIIAYINLYDMLSLTVGFELVEFQYNLESNNINEVFSFIKQKVVTTGEKILNVLDLF